MRVLMLTHRIPFPPNKGDKIRSFNIMTHLSRQHDVYVASLVDDADDLRHVPQVEARTRKFVFDRIDGRRRAVSALRAMVASQAISVSHFYSGRLQEQIDSLIENDRIEAVFCFSSPMAEYLFRSRHAGAKLAGALKAMDLIDVDSFKWIQYAQTAPALTAWIYRREGRLLQQYELRIAREFDRVYVVSEQERTYFPGGTATANLYALRNGVDLEFFSPGAVPALESAGPVLVFTGVMDYWPNVDGIKWFVESILPRIRAAVPGVRLYIVGSRPTKEVQRLSQSEGVVVTGFVEDVRRYLAGAAACVVPLRIARGIQNKVLEAMSMGKAVVSTPQAFEGIRAVAGEDVVVAGGEEAFAAATIELLQDPVRAGRIGCNARRCIEQYHSWDQNLAPLNELAAIAGRGATA